MLARHRLKTRGCVVLYDAVPETKTRALLAEADDETNYWIHDTFNGVLQDDYRFRSFISQRLSDDLSQYFERHYRTFFPLATTPEWRFSRMISGAEDQPVRREFAPPPADIDCTNVCSVPGSVLIATQDQTYVYVYGWNNQVALYSDQQLIELNQGDVLISRGDQAYATVGGKVNRTCVHGCIDTPLYARPPYPQPVMVPLIDDTREVDDLFCFVWNCTYRGQNYEMLRKHLNRYHRFYFNRTRATSMP